MYGWNHQRSYRQCHWCTTTKVPMYVQGIIARLTPHWRQRLVFCIVTVDVKKCEICYSMCPYAVCDDGKPPTWLEESEHLLVGHNYARLPDVTSADECKRLCLQDSKCRSIEYVTSTRECAVSYSVRSSARDSFVPDPNVDYYEWRCTGGEVIYSSCVILGASCARHYPYVFVRHIRLLHSCHCLQQVSLNRLFIYLLFMLHLFIFSSPLPVFACLFACVRACGRACVRSENVRLLLFSQKKPVRNLKNSNSVFIYIQDTCDVDLCQKL